MSDLTIPWSTFFILIVLLLAMAALWFLQLRQNDYDILDLFMEGEPRKASLNKHILIGSFLLAVWLVVMRSLDTFDTIPANVDSLLLGVLGIFVVGRVGSHAVERFSRRPESSPIVESAGDVNVTVEAPPKMAPTKK